MGFESHGNNISPAGFAFGGEPTVSGWTYNEPRPTSITWFLDNTAMVCDQYGRPIRFAVTNDGTTVRFADSPPIASEIGEIIPRPEFATHQQVIAALTSERIDWLAYTIRYRLNDGSIKTINGLNKEQADKKFTQLVKENSRPVMVRTIACAGWPQLSYEELKKLPELPMTPIEELLKIRDPQLRDDALKALGLELDSSLLNKQPVLPPGVRYAQFKEKMAAEVE